MESPPNSTLYKLLAEPAPDESARGETITTKAKETVDNDVEAFAFEELAVGV
jgi:hypothetical protein